MKEGSRMRPEGWTIVIVAVIALLLFGGAKLPSIAKNLGQSMRVFRKEMKTLGEERAADKSPTQAADKPGEQPSAPVDPTVEDKK